MRVDYVLKILISFKHVKIVKMLIYDIVLKRKKIFTLTSYNFCISTLLLKFEMIICMICKCSLNEINSDFIKEPKMLMVLEVPTIRSHIVVDLC